MTDPDMLTSIAIVRDLTDIGTGQFVTDDEIRGWLAEPTDEDDMGRILHAAKHVRMKEEMEPGFNAADLQWLAWRMRR